MFGGVGVGMGCCGIVGENGGWRVRGMIRLRLIHYIRRNLIIPRTLEVL